MVDKPSVSCPAVNVEVTSSADAVVRPASDVVQPSTSVSSTTTMTTSLDTLPTRPPIPFAQGWLSGSSKWRMLRCISSYYNKCTKHQFIHLLAAALKNSHIENCKNHKRWYCSRHTDCVSMCCWILSPFVIFAVFDVRVLQCCL